MSKHYVFAVEFGENVTAAWGASETNLVWTFVVTLYVETHCRVAWIQSTYVTNQNVLLSSFNALSVLSVTSPCSHPLLPPPKFSSCLTLVVIHQLSQIPPTTTAAIPFLTLRLCPSVFNVSVCTLCLCLVSKVWRSWQVSWLQCPHVGVSVTCLSAKTNRCFFENCRRNCNCLNCVR